MFIQCHAWLTHADSRYSPIHRKVSSIVAVPWSVSPLQDGILYKSCQDPKSRSKRRLWTAWYSTQFRFKRTRIYITTSSEIKPVNGTTCHRTGVAGYLHGLCVSCTYLPDGSIYCTSNHAIKAPNWISSWSIFCWKRLRGQIRRL